jgi:hypothetical protein
LPGYRFERIFVVHSADASAFPDNFPSVVANAMHPTVASPPDVAQIRQEDLNTAALDGLISPEQAQALWARWSTAGIATCCIAVRVAETAYGP